jgi:hypothetical protein
VPKEALVACILSNAELRQRETTLLAQFKSAVIATEELDEGYWFRLPGDKKHSALVTEVLLAERDCCPFLRFELTAEPNQGPLELRLTGPAGTKDFLRSVLI